MSRPLNRFPLDWDEVRARQRNNRSNPMPERILNLILSLLAIVAFVAVAAWLLRLAGVI